GERPRGAGRGRGTIARDHVSPPGRTARRAAGRRGARHGRRAGIPVDRAATGRRRERKLVGALRRPSGRGTLRHLRRGVARGARPCRARRCRTGPRTPRWRVL
ncbi:MAG: hypothetical protein AVDCRST_MAG18-935, partial [uncultured Thermomicrobiales bacterium]